MISVLKSVIDFLILRFASEALYIYSRYLGDILMTNSIKFNFETYATSDCVWWMPHNVILKSHPFLLIILVRLTWHCILSPEVLKNCKLMSLCSLPISQHIHTMISDVICIEHIYFSWRQSVTVTTSGDKWQSMSNKSE